MRLRAVLRKSCSTHGAIGLRPSRLRSLGELGIERGLGFGKTRERRFALIGREHKAFAPLAEQPDHRVGQRHKVVAAAFVARAGHGPVAPLDLVPCHIADHRPPRGGKEQRAHEVREACRRLVAKIVERGPQVHDLVIGEDTAARPFGGWLGAAHAFDDGRRELIVAGRVPVQSSAQMRQHPVGHYRRASVLDRVEQIDNIAPPEIVDRLAADLRPHINPETPLDLVRAAQVRPCVSFEEIVEQAIDRITRRLPPLGRHRRG